MGYSLDYIKIVNGHKIYIHEWGESIECNRCGGCGEYALNEYVHFSCDSHKFQTDSWGEVIKHTLRDTISKKKMNKLRKGSK